MEEQISQLSPRHRVSAIQWVVGMLRKPNSSNPHHVLLIVEGVNNFGQVILRRYDLQIDQNRAKDPDSQQEYSKIVLRPDVFCASQEAKTQLDLLIHAETYYVKAWSISWEQAMTLHDNIEETAKNPPQYLVSGNETSLCWEKNSSYPKGHSCYTWARYELNRIGLNIPKNPLDKIIAVPDFLIKPEIPSPENDNVCRIS